MKKSIILIFILLLCIVFYTCTQKSSSPVESTSNSVSKLQKQAWLDSDLYYWPWQAVSVYGANNQFCYHWQKAEDNTSFTFQNYTFSFVKNTSTISVYLNNTHVGDITRLNSTDWASISFQFDNKSMVAKVQFYDQLIYSECTNIYSHIYEPGIVSASILSYVLPDAPTGFSVSPSAHPGVAANPVLTWNQTLDPDVSLVEIWRRNNNPNTSYSLIATISKSNTSYTDTSCDWKLPLGRTYWYRIKFKDGTHNLSSPATDELESSSL